MVIPMLTLRFAGIGIEAALVDLLRISAQVAEWKRAVCGFGREVIIVWRSNLVARRRLAVLMGEPWSSFDREKHLPPRALGLVIGRIEQVIDGQERSFSQGWLAGLFGFQLAVQKQ